MTLSKGKGGRKSTETEAQRARDMWIARRASESSLLNEDKGPLPTTGDIDALIEWNALSTKRHGRSVRLANDPPVSQELTRQQIRAWKKRADDCRANFKHVLLWPCMYCLHYIDYKERPKSSRFFCRRSECVSRGKVQVNCLWKITEGIEWRRDKRASVIPRRSDDGASMATTNADTVRPH